MSRGTQYIGLNGRAEALLDHVFGKKWPPARTHETVPGYLHVYDESDCIRLREWVVPKGPLNEYDDDVVLREVVQAAPCSSGPMFFTQLLLVYKDKMETAQGTEDWATPVCGWVLDPMVKYDCEFGCAEYDYATGRYWV